MRKFLVVSAALLGLSAPAYAMTEAECTTMWTQADTNADGNLSGAEGERYLAMLRIANKPLAADGVLDSATFRGNCLADAFKFASIEEGAPITGANSFTEQQARDRVIAAGHANVSAMTLDANGIWRGKATMNGAASDVAVDFKGNVVATKS